MVARQVLLVVLLIGTAIGSGLLTAQERGDKPTTDPKGIQRLIDRLGSGQFATRDQAAKQLLDLGEAALPALQKALQSLDPEVRRQAERIMAEINTKAEERVVEKLLAEANQAGLDKFIARMVNEKEFATEARWKAVYKLAHQAVARATEIGGKEYRPPVIALDVPKLPTVREPKDDQFTESKVLVAGMKAFLSIGRCVFLSSGSVEHVTGIDDSIVIVDGDIESCTVIRNCVVLCRGDIRKVNSIVGSVVLATGQIHKATGIDDSLIQVGGVGQCPGSRRSVYVNLAKIPARHSQDDRCVQAKEGPLQLFRFSVPGGRLDPQNVRADLKLLAEVNKEGIDRFIARMVNEKEFATEERWKVMETLAQAIAARAAEVGGKRVRTPAMDVSKLPTAREPKEDQFTKVKVLTPGTKELLSIEGCVFLSSGPVQFVTNLQDSIVVVDGDIDCTTIQNCIILCRGNVKGATSIEGSVVLATGKIHQAGVIEDSLIQVSGVGQCNGSQRSIYVNLAKSPANLSRDDRCVQTKEGPLQLIRFSAGDSPKK